MTPSPNPSPRHSNVRPSHLLLQNVSPRTAENNGVHRLAPNRGMLHSRQASNNSNQQSSLDDSGVVDDHDADDVTSVEEHDRRDNKECRGNWQERTPTNNKNGDANGETNPDQTRNGMNNETEVNDNEREESEATHSGGYLRTSANVPVSLTGGPTREFRVFKCNGVKTKKQMYTLPPEYLSHIVILGRIIYTRREFLKSQPWKKKIKNELKIWNKIFSKRLSLRICRIMYAIMYLSAWFIYCQSYVLNYTKYLFTLLFTNTNRND